MGRLSGARRGRDADVRDEHYVHAGRSGGQNTVERVLDDQTGFGAHAQPMGREQIHVRGGLAGTHLVGRRYCPKQSPHAQTVEGRLDDPRWSRGRNRQRIEACQLAHGFHRALDRRRSEARIPLQHAVDHGTLDLVFREIELQPVAHARPPLAGV